MLSLLFNNIKGENKKLKITTLIGATTLFDIQYNNPKLFSLQDSLNINIYNKLYNNDLKVHHQMCKYIRFLILSES